MYKGGALKVNPAVAIVAVLVGANLAGVLGALLAIPTAASLGRGDRRAGADRPAAAAPRSRAVEQAEAGQVAPRPRFQNGSPRAPSKRFFDALAASRAGRRASPRREWGLPRRNAPTSATSGTTTARAAPSRTSPWTTLTSASTMPTTPERRRRRRTRSSSTSSAASTQPLKPTSSMPAIARGDDHGVDRAPALLLPVDVLEVEPERELVQRQPGADPEEDRGDLAPGRVRVATATPIQPKISSSRIPQTRWWMCVPPTETLPGHQLTCARIMWVLVRMKPNVSRKATKNRNCGLAPGVDDALLVERMPMDADQRAQRNPACVSKQLAAVSSPLPPAQRSRPASPLSCRCRRRRRVRRPGAAAELVPARVRPRAGRRRRCRERVSGPGPPSRWSARGAADDAVAAGAAVERAVAGRRRRRRTTTGRSGRP